MLLFTTAGIKIEVKPEVLKAGTSSELEINVYRSNIAGIKVPFSKADVRFEIEEGANLIEIANYSSDGYAKVRSKGIEGEAVIGIYSLRSGMQVSRILIKVLPRDAA